VHDEPIKSTVLHLLALAHREEHGLFGSLSDAERAAIGTPECWSAKDTLAHIATWKRMHAEKLATVAGGESPPTWTDDAVIDHVNAESFATSQTCSWGEIVRDAEQAYGALVAAVGRFGERELTDPHAFPRMRGHPVWPETLGNGCWHPFSHMTALAEQSDDTARLARIQAAHLDARERMVAAMERSGTPRTTMTTDLYNLACLYTLNGKPAQAVALLSEAIQARPDLALHARHDADFASLAEHPDFQRLIATARDAVLIAPQAASEGNARGTVLIVDVRDPDEFAAGHVAGAHNVPLDELERLMGELPRDRTVVTYCNMAHRGASRGERAASLLASRGFDAQALDGGYPGWKAAGLPVEEQIPKAGAS
jgi:rhodanese-related sulfurtransferase